MKQLGQLPWPLTSSVTRSSAAAMEILFIVIATDALEDISTHAIDYIE